MTGGTRTLMVAGCLTAATSCATSHDLKVRPIADAGARFRQGGDLLAEARGALALGNAGTALEGFRKLQREQPENKDVFAGIAACYAAMGRFDLARANYEYALAYAPNDPALLNALASTLDRLGEADQAGQVRHEAARLASPAPPTDGQAALTAIDVPRIASVTVELPRVREPEAAPAPSHPAMDSSGRPAPVQEPPREAKVKIEVADARDGPPPLPEPIQSAPHLERLSPGEVALITTPRAVDIVAPKSGVAAEAVPAVDRHPTAPKKPVSPQLAAVAVRWAPLRSSAEAQDIELLNAARYQGLAARTRSALLGRGWTKIRIGDARATRQHSVVLYTPARAAMAHRLAAQFRCKATPAANVRNIVVVLGRDAVGRRTSARA